MRRLVPIVLGLLIPQWAMALTVTTTVEPEKVRPGESVVVTYEADGQASQPDFAPLQRDFDIVDRRQSQNIAVVNGQATYEMVWSLVLMPRKTGKLALPAIDFGGVSSETRTITVLDEDADSGSSSSTSRSEDTSGNIDVTYGIDDATPYVNQQVLLTTKVYTAVDVEDLKVSTPEVTAGKAEIRQLGAPRKYQSMRNGRQYSVREQRYTLVPKGSGALKLSPLEITGRIDGKPVTRHADPPKIDVISATSGGHGDKGVLAPDDLFLEAEVDKSSPYVQEQVILTVRLFRAIAIENATLSTPEISGGDAVVERLGNDRRFEATRHGRRYAVTERRFVLFPQTSGALTVEPVDLEAAIPVAYGNGSIGGFWNRPLTRPVQVHTDPLGIEVRTPPDGASRPWLPAADLTIEEQWPERDSFEVGAPITRRITVNADEMLASQLPTLDAPLPDGVKSYPDKPRRETSSDDNGVTAQLDQTVTLIPSKAGTFTVPAFELSWWNTAEDRQETVSLPAHTFEVAPAPGSAATESNPPEETAAGTPPPAAATAESGIFRWVSLGLALAWLATLAVWWLDRRRRTPPEETDRAAANESLRRAEKRLREACRRGDTAAARDALLAWGRAWRPDKPPRSLGALEAAAGDHVAAEIGRLRQALYAPGGGTWQGEDLYKAVAAFRPPAAGDGQDVGLRPLYQH